MADIKLAEEQETPEDNKVDVADVAAKGQSGGSEKREVKPASLGSIRKSIKSGGKLAADKPKVILDTDDGPQEVVFRNLMVADEVVIERTLLSKRLTDALVDFDENPGTKEQEKQLNEEITKEVRDSKGLKMRKAVLLCWESPEGITMEDLEYIDDVWIEKAYLAIIKKKNEVSSVDLFR